MVITANMRRREFSVSAVFALAAKMALMIPRRAGDGIRSLGLEMPKGSIVDLADVAKLEEEPATLEPQVVETEARESRESAHWQSFFSQTSRETKMVSTMSRRSARPQDVGTEASES